MLGIFACIVKCETSRQKAHVSKWIDNADHRWTFYLFKDKGWGGGKCILEHGHLSHHRWNIKISFKLKTCFLCFIPSIAWNHVCIIESHSHFAFSLHGTPYTFVVRKWLIYSNTRLIHYDERYRITICTLFSLTHIPRFVTLLGVPVKASQSIHQQDKWLRKVKCFLCPRQNRNTAFELYSILPRNTNTEYIIRDCFIHTLLYIPYYREALWLLKFRLLLILNPTLRYLMHFILYAHLNREM